MEDWEVDVIHMDNSRIKLCIILLLGTICNNNPRLIGKIIENGMLDKLMESLQQAIPLHGKIFDHLCNFIHRLSIHSEGRKYLIEKRVIEYLLMPWADEHKS